MSKDVADTTRASAEKISHTAVEAALDAAIASPTRTPANVERDVWRHPKETLMFFGVEPDDVVVEIWPGGGWYTEILAPYLAERGTLIAGSFRGTDDPENYRTKTRAKFEARLTNEPAFAKVVNGTFDPPVLLDVGPPESADVVLTFRNIHNFMNPNTLPDMFSAAYTVLKPGGTLGIVEHRAAESDADPMQVAKTGYVAQSYVIEMAKSHGFELVGTSEINANPKDNRDHPEGVWTLPPSLRLKDVDREKYLAIGESDRMTLKFRKLKK
ncbi:MAG: methyltransferase [bacterium]